MDLFFILETKIFSPYLKLCLLVQNDGIHVTHFNIKFIKCDNTIT